MPWGDVQIEQWSVLDGYMGNRQTRSSYTIPSEKVTSILQEQALLPIGQKSLSQLWCKNPPPRVDIHQLFRTENIPTSARVLLLDVLSCDPNPQDVPLLWEIFIQSRLGVIAEDPDLFTRSLRLIVQIEKQYPQSNQKLFTTTLPSLFQQGIQHRDGQTVPINQLQNILESYYDQHDYLGIEAFLSEKGSLFQEIITQATQGDTAAPALPQHQPGQYQKVPLTPFHQAPIHRYDHTWSPSILLIGLMGILLSLLAFRTRYKRMVAILFGVSVICTIEGGFELFEQPTYAQARPLFSFIDFSFQPYEEIYRDDQRWWVSQGGPTRWQEIPDHEDIFRIAVLGASSAHASNLLQHESFSSLLEKQLQSEFGDTPIQVVNMAIGGTISNGVLSSGSQAIEMGADAIIIYYGHNEVAQFQQLTHFQDMNSMTTRIFFSQSRIYAWLHALFSQETKEQLNTTITKRPSSRQITQWAAMNHRQNIGLLLEQCSNKDIPVLQIIPTYNFRFAPFEPQQPEPNSTAKQILQEAKAFRSIDIQKTQTKLLEALSFSTKGSDTFIQSQQIYAEILSDQGQHTEARTAYQQLFDHSFEITTIHTNIKTNIAQLAQQHGTALLDAEEIFYHNSPDGITANGLFWDELHPNARGHQYLAQAIIPWAREQTTNFLGSSPNP